MDCVSRWLGLGKDFPEELARLAEPARARGLELVGVLSLGEIAADGRRLLEYLNKTCAYGAFHE